MKYLLIAAAALGMAACYYTPAKADTCGHGVELSKKLRKIGMKPVLQGTDIDVKLDEEFWVNDRFTLMIIVRSKHDGKTDAVCYETVTIDRLDDRSIVEAVKKAGEPH